MMRRAKELKKEIETVIKPFQEVMFAIFELHRFHLRDGRGWDGLHGSHCTRTISKWRWREWNDHPTAAGPAPDCQEADSLVLHGEEEKESRQPERSVWCVWGGVY